MKKLLVILFVVIVVAGIVWFVTTTRKGEGEHLVVTGSATLAPVMKRIAARFEAAHPGVHIDVQADGSGRGGDDVRGGLADIGMISGRPDDGTDLHRFAVATDALAFIVHRDNPVAGLSRDQVGAVYSGGVANWRPVGGPNRPVTPVTWEEGRGPLIAFLEYTGLHNGAIKADIIAGQNDQVIHAVARLEGAVGYLPLGAALSAVARGLPVRLISLDGIAATRVNVANGSYPVIITHSLVTRAPPRGLARQLIDFARSPRNDDLIENAGLARPAGP